MAPMLATPKPTSRLFLASNRLPVTVTRNETEEYEFAEGTGGLVSGLRGLSKSTQFLWYGWPGLEVSEGETTPLAAKLKERFGVVPVYLGDGQADLYYNGFSSTSAPSCCLLTIDLAFFRRNPMATSPLPPRGDYLHRGQLAGI